MVFGGSRASQSREDGSAPDAQVVLDREPALRTGETGAAGGGMAASCSDPGPSPRDPRAVPRPSRGPTSTAGRMPSSVYALAIALLLGVLWWIGSAGSWWRSVVLPPPGKVGSEFWDLLGTAQFWGDIRVTCTEVLLSLVFGSALGGLLGAFFWRYPVLGRSLEPYVVSFYAVPLIVLYPVMIVVIGLGPSSLIVLDTIVVIIPVLLNVWIGLEATPPGYLKLARSLRLNTLQVLFTVAVPSASRQIAAGMQIAMGVAISGAVGMEFLMAPQGMGFRVRYYYESMESAKVLAYVIALFVVAIVFVSGLAVIEKTVLRRLHAN